MLSFGWSPLVRQLPSPLVPLVILLVLFLLIIIKYFFEFFAPALADDISMEFGWQQVSLSLLDFSQYSDRS